MWIAEFLVERDGSAPVLLGRFAMAGMVQHSAKTLVSQRFAVPVVDLPVHGQCLLAVRPRLVELP